MEMVVWQLGNEVKGQAGNFTGRDAHPRGSEHGPMMVGTFAQ